MTWRGKLEWCICLAAMEHLIILTELSIYGQHQCKPSGFPCGVTTPTLIKHRVQTRKEIETDEFLYTYRVGGSFTQAFSTVRAVSL